MNARRGFSLIELMVVIVIMGLLAAIAIPKYNITAHKSKEKEADMVLAQIYRLQQVYRNEFQEYAPTQAELQSVGFKDPGQMRYYVWDGDVEIPVCLRSTGVWKSRQVLEDGRIVNCDP